MSTIKIILPVLLVVVISTLTARYYFSDKQSSERQFIAMINSNHVSFDTLLYYLSHHQHEIDTDYDKALQMAAQYEPKYLYEVIDYYSQGEIILDTDIVQEILDLLPNDSININHAAGRIYAVREFGHYDPLKAVKHLEYAALRGDRNAAEILSSIYTQSNCVIEAITWAKIANSRDMVSDCTKLPVDVNQLSNEEWDAVLHNESALEHAAINKTIAKLKYSNECPLNINKP